MSDIVFILSYKIDEEIATLQGEMQRKILKVKQNTIPSFEGGLTHYSQPLAFKTDSNYSVT